MVGKSAVTAAFAVVGVMIANPTRRDDAIAAHLRQNISRPRYFYWGFKISDWVKQALTQKQRRLNASYAKA
jgi:cAMP phosphodiesterase